MAAACSLVKSVDQGAISTRYSPDVLRMWMLTSGSSVINRRHIPDAMMYLTVTSRTYSGFRTWVLASKTCTTVTRGCSTSPTSTFYHPIRTVHLTPSGLCSELTHDANDLGRICSLT